MRNCDKIYVDGAWISPAVADMRPVLNPTSGKVSGSVCRASEAELNAAVAAARQAFATYSLTGVAERKALLGRITEVYQSRFEDMVDALCLELGAPRWLAKDLQAMLPLAHLQVAAAALDDYAFETPRGRTLLRHEPIGVCGMITPWNWPVHQIAAKVVPALATGCTMVLKPAELAPYSAQVFAEILDEAGVPAGVFNLVYGRGKTIGAGLAAHPDIDMISFTGSTAAGAEVARQAAATVKRVCQELGGKSANVVLDDADLSIAIPAAVRAAMLNTGQTCSALTRLIVPASRLTEVEAIASATCAEISVGLPDDNAMMGPLVSDAQWQIVQNYIRIGEEEGAKLVAGGLGRPDGRREGAFARPTVFSNVTPSMTIAREEIFGPVLVILTYQDVEEAIAIANDSPYGLSGGVQGTNLAMVKEVAARLRTGQVYLNNADVDFAAPFGGYRQSGNGREWGDLGFAEYLETKAVIGV